MDDLYAIALEVIEHFVAERSTNGLHADWLKIVPLDPINGWAFTEIAWKTCARRITDIYAQRLGKKLSATDSELGELRSLPLAAFADYLVSLAEEALAYTGRENALLAQRVVDTAPAVSGPDKGAIYSVWFGTNREPYDPDDFSQGFSSARSKTTYYGRCTVNVPKSHRFGTIGPGFFGTILPLENGRLTLKAIQVLGESSFWAEVRVVLGHCEARGRQALVFLHGYNTSFHEAAIRTAQIGYDLKVSGLTAFFSWPSRGDVKAYSADEASVEASEGAITQFLIRFLIDSGAEKVHIVAHSMGNRALLRAMQRIQSETLARTGVKFGQVFLAAPDVDVDIFKDLAAAYPALSERTTLYVSPKDRAVKMSRILHGAPRVGLTPPVTIVPDLDTIVVPHRDLMDLGHGYYAEFAGVLSDMFALMRQNAPPEDRQRLIRETDGSETYWSIRL